MLDKNKIKLGWKSLSSKDLKLSELVISTLQVIMKFFMIENGWVFFYLHLFILKYIFDEIGKFFIFLYVFI